LSTPSAARHLIALLAALVIQQTPPPFSFRQITAELSQSAAIQAGLVDQCRDDTLAGRPVVNCRATRALWEGGISGFEHYGLSLRFYPGGLAAMESAVLPQGFGPISSAFAQKFGEPCEAREAVLTNAFGASFPQRTLVWCLSDGKLELSDRHPRSFDRAQVLFVSDRFLATPTPRGTVNF
jgi:hypothetical protein